jgi:hypothetical protein
MNVYCLLDAIDDDMRNNLYISFAMYNIPEMSTFSVPFNEWIKEQHDAILKADVVTFNIKVDKNYGYLMLTILINM